MRYESSETGCGYRDAGHRTMNTIVDIGDVDGRVARWWSAILAQREGWTAVIRESPDCEFFAPWTVSRKCETSFAIEWSRKSSVLDDDYPPLTSSEAFEALAQFALLHGLSSQFPVALASAVMFPTHNFHGSTVQLPFPTAMGAKRLSAPPHTIPPIWANLEQDLPYYMTLSCSPELLISILCGSFWEPEIPCNLVSPWLHPVINEVLESASPDMDMPGPNQEVLALIGAIRQPNISALWLGAAISGLCPIVLRRVRRGRPPLDPHAYPWTGCPQSFIDVPGSGPYMREGSERVSRQDVWRLLHLPPTEQDDLSYRYRPFTPWPPCGSTPRENCALRVVSHLRCGRHQFEYSHWNWELEDGTLVRDDGFSRTPLPVVTSTSDPFDVKEPRNFPKKDLDQEASHEASLDIFRWFIINGEGVPSESIYQDDWLKDIWEEDTSSDEEHEAAMQNSPGPVGPEDRCEAWLGNVD